MLLVLSRRRNQRFPGKSSRLYAAVLLVRRAAVPKSAAAGQPILWNVTVTLKQSFFALVYGGFIFLHYLIWW